MFDPDGRLIMAEITEAMWNATPDGTNYLLVCLDLHNKTINRGESQLSKHISIKEIIALWMILQKIYKKFSLKQETRN